MFVQLIFLNSTTYFFNIYYCLVCVNVIGFSFGYHVPDDYSMDDGTTTAINDRESRESHAPVRGGESRPSEDFVN